MLRHMSTTGRLEGYKRGYRACNSGFTWGSDASIHEERAKRLRFEEATSAARIVPEESELNLTVGQLLPVEALRSRGHVVESSGPTQPMHVSPPPSMAPPLVLPQAAGLRRDLATATAAHAAGAESSAPAICAAPEHTSRVTCAYEKGTWEVERAVPLLPVPDPPPATSCLPAQGAWGYAESFSYARECVPEAQAAASSPQARWPEESRSSDVPLPNVCSSEGYTEQMSFQALSARVASPGAPVDACVADVIFCADRNASEAASDDPEVAEQGAASPTSQHNADCLVAAQGVLQELPSPPSSASDLSDAFMSKPEQSQAEQLAPASSGTDATPEGAEEVPRLCPTEQDAEGLQPSRQKNDTGVEEESQPRRETEVARVASESQGHQDQTLRSGGECVSELVSPQAAIVAGVQRAGDALIDLAARSGDLEKQCQATEKAIERLGLLRQAEEARVERLATRADALDSQCRGAKESLSRLQTSRQAEEARVAGLVEQCRAAATLADELATRCRTAEATLVRLQGEEARVGRLSTQAHDVAVRCQASEELLVRLQGAEPRVSDLMQQAAKAKADAEAAVEQHDHLMQAKEQCPQEAKQSSPPPAAQPELMSAEVHTEEPAQASASEAAAGGSASAARRSAPEQAGRPQVSTPPSHSTHVEQAKARNGGTTDPFRRFVEACGKKEMTEAARWLVLWSAERLPCLEGTAGWRKHAQIACNISTNLAAASRRQQEPSDALIAGCRLNLYLLSVYIEYCKIALARAGVQLEVPDDVVSNPALRAEEFGVPAPPLHPNVPVAELVNWGNRVVTACL